MNCAPIKELAPGFPLADGSGMPADMCTYHKPTDWWRHKSMREMYARFLVPTGPACVGNVDWRVCA